MAYVTHDSKGNPRRESNPWIEDSLEKEIKRLKEEKKHLEEVFLEIMEMTPRQPPNLGWIETKLDQKHINYLWKRIKERKTESFKHSLAGNIKG